MKHNFRALLVVSSAVAILSCSHALRLPADVEASKNVDLTSLSQDLLSSVSSRSFTSENCASYLTNVITAIERMDWQDAIAQLKAANVEETVESFWSSRVILHDKIPVLGTVCHNEIKRAFVTLRYLEDYIVETSRKTASVDLAHIDFQSQPIPMRENSPRYLSLYRKDNGSLDLQNGDVMLTRGVSFLSAMISRLGEPSQFSHVVMVANDPKDSKLKTIESYVGKGVDFYEMDYALKYENARILILRPREQNIAIKSSTRISTLVRTSLDEKKRIKYDYDLNFSDRKTLSCAEVSQYAFDLGSDNTMHIPMYPSVFPKKLDLLTKLGVRGGETYAPGDLEIDPRFELIGEFRDLGITRDGRQKDAILTSIVNWMKKDRYELRPGFKARMALPVWIARRTFLWPLVQKMLTKKGEKPFELSPEVPVKMIRTMTMMNDIGEVLLNVVKQADAEYEAKSGLPMSYFQILGLLEQFRKDDLALYQNLKTRGKSTLHKKFSPDGAKQAAAE